MIQIKCNNCHREFAITRSKCPFCNDQVKTSCKFYCGTCESKLKIGDFKCSKCQKYPDEIIIEYSDGNRVKTEFITEDENTNSSYKDKMHLRYVIIPQFIYWGMFIIIGLVLLAKISGLNLCDLDNNCGNSNSFDPSIIMLLPVGISIWILYTWPILLILYALYNKYKELTDIELLEKEKSKDTFKCNHCGKNFHINRGMMTCPHCKHDITDEYKLYCSRCEKEIEPGQVICSKCLIIPKEIIIEKKNGERIKSTFINSEKK